MSTIFQVLIDGEVRLTIPGVIRDGAVWGYSGSPTPLINSTLLAQRGLTADDVRRATASGNWSADLRACFMRIGENAGGRTVVNKTEADRREHEEWLANRSPAELRRVELAAMWSNVERCDRSQDDVEYDRLRFAAQSAQEKFHAEFPAELKADQVPQLRARAEHARHLASGAMTYDADGWLDAQEQERRAAKYRDEAAELDRQADDLEK